MSNNLDWLFSETSDSEVSSSEYETEEELGRSYEEIDMVGEIQKASELIMHIYFSSV